MSFSKKFKIKSPIRQNGNIGDKVKKLRKSLKENYNLPLQPEDDYPNIELTDDMFSPSQEKIRQWNKARKATGRFEDQLGGGNLKRQELNLASTKTLSNEKEFYKNYADQIKKAKTDEEGEKLGITKGYLSKAKKLNPDQLQQAMQSEQGQQGNPAGGYFKGTHTSFVRPHSFSENLKVLGGIIPSSQTNKRHEAAHSANPRPQENKISEIIGTTKDSDYFNKPSEIYARLMAYRIDNNIDPNRVFTKEDIPELKEKMRSYDLLFGSVGGKVPENSIKIEGAASDEKILRLMNEVAFVEPTWQEKMERKNMT